MKRLLVMFLCIVWFTFGAFAQSSGTIDISKMTAEQQKALQTMAEQLTANKSEPSAVMEAIKSLNVDKDTISGWSQAGTEAGKAVTNFTKEIAVPAKDFMDTFIGKAIFLIVFMNYGGGKLASFLLDIGIFVSLTPFFLVFINKVFRRFVLHQRPDGNKSWIPVRSKKEGEEVGITFEGSPIKVSTVEAILGWIFIVVITTFYMATMWPTWPL